MDRCARRYEHTGISPSGNVHGMPLACCLGIGPHELTASLGYSPKVKGRNVVLIGLRDVDKRERETCARVRRNCLHDARYR